MLVYEGSSASARKIAKSRLAGFVGRPLAIVLISLGLPYLMDGSSLRFWVTSKTAVFNDLIVGEETTAPPNFADFIPFDASLPSDMVGARTTLNPNLEVWFSAAIVKDLGKVRNRVLFFGGNFDANVHVPKINAVLVDAKGRVRVMASNAPKLYFGSQSFPIASTGKIFIALALGKHNSPDASYCIPPAITSWVEVDAERSSQCEVTGRKISARAAFARSMQSPILWRSLRILGEGELRNVFQQLGITNLNYSSLRYGAIVGSIKVPAIYLHRAALAITLAFADKREPIQTPTLIDEVMAGKPAHIQRIARASIDAQRYASVMGHNVRLYASDILSSPIRQGTLHELVNFARRREITKLWGKTGTFSVRGNTRHIWIVGGLVANGQPYSYLVFVKASDDNRSFGNANASAFAPLAGDLIEAAIRDSLTSREP